jgi:prepilin-type N-terminal cleavage/methylation domain-containing protein
VGETLKRKPSAPEGHGTMSNRSQGGFSLVELLVVIAVVAMLTCLLTFAIHKMRRFAERAKSCPRIEQVTIPCPGGQHCHSAEIPGEPGQAR